MGPGDRRGGGPESPYLGEFSPSPRPVFCRRRFRARRGPAPENPEPGLPGLPPRGGHESGTPHNGCPSSDPPGAPLHEDPQRRCRGRTKNTHMKTIQSHGPEAPRGSVLWLSGSLGCAPRAPPSARRQRPAPGGEAPPPPEGGSRRMTGAPPAVAHRPGTSALVGSRQAPATLGVSSVLFPVPGVFFPSGISVGALP